MNNNNHKLVCKNFCESDIGNQGVQIQEETVDGIKYDGKNITVGVTIGDIQGKQGIQQEELTVKRDIKGTGKDAAGVAIGDLSNQGIQEETVKWDIKGVGKGTTGVVIGDSSNQGIQEETVKQDIKGVGKGTTGVVIGDLSNQEIQEEMVKQGTGRGIAGITIINGNDRSVIMAKEGHTYRIDTVVDIKSKSNQRKTMYKKKETQCQLKYEDMDDKIMLSTKAVPRDHSYELSQWRKKDRIRKQYLLLITFIVLVVEVMILLLFNILMALIVGLSMLTIGLIMFYKVNAGKESQDEFRYEVSFFIEQWRKQDNLQIYKHDKLKQQRNQESLILETRRYQIFLG